MTQKIIIVVWFIIQFNNGSLWCRQDKIIQKFCPSFFPQTFNMNVVKENMYRSFFHSVTKRAKGSVCYSRSVQNAKQCKQLLNVVTVNLLQSISICKLSLMSTNFEMNFRITRIKQDEKKFFETKMKIQNVLKIQKMRSLTLEGKIIVFKTLAIVYLSIMIKVPAEILYELK